MHYARSEECAGYGLLRALRDIKDATSYASARHRDRSENVPIGMERTKQPVTKKSLENGCSLPACDTGNTGSCTQSLAKVTRLYVSLPSGKRRLVEILVAVPFQTVGTPTQSAIDC